MLSLPVFCADKGYKFIEDIIRTKTEKLQSAFAPTYPDATRWSYTYHVEVTTVDPLGLLDANGLRMTIKETQLRTNVFNPNL